MNELYYSNKGRGPGVAEVVERTSERVCIVWRPYANSKRRNYVELSRRFFESKSCGWVKRSS